MAILDCMASRVGPSGEVVIPKAIRDDLGIVPGDEVAVSLDGGTIRVELRRGLQSLRGQFAGLDLTAMLEADRRAERDR